jgi:hypothetical protein
MKFPYPSQIPRRVRWFCAVTLATVAAFAFLAYINSGQAIDDSIGVPGWDTAAAQREVILWFWILLVSEVGLVIAVFSLLRFDGEAEFLPRVFAQSMAAILLSGLGTVGLSAALSVVFIGAAVLAGR